MVWSHGAHLPDSDEEQGHHAPLRGQMKKPLWCPGQDKILYVKRRTKTVFKKNTMTFHLGVNQLELPNLDL